MTTCNTTKTAQHLVLRVKHLQNTVNQEYFICILFSFILYVAASVRKQNAHQKFKASRRIRSGQWLYENFMRTKGWGPLAYENLVRVNYSGFTILGHVLFFLCFSSLFFHQTYAGARKKNKMSKEKKKRTGSVFQTT